MSPDVFLSHQNPPIRYGAPLANAAEFVAALQILNKTRTLSEDGFLDDVFYKTQGLTWRSAVDPATIDPKDLTLEQAASDRYDSAKAAGNLAAAHRAVDAINAVRAKYGIRAFQPASDFDIIASGSGPLAMVARNIANDRVAFATGTPVFGSPVPWFDTPEGYKLLADYVAS